MKWKSLCFQQISFPPHLEDDICADEREKNKSILLLCVELLCASFMLFAIAFGYVPLNKLVHRTDKNELEISAFSCMKYAKNFSFLSFSSDTFLNSHSSSILPAVRLLLCVSYFKSSPFATKQKHVKCENINFYEFKREKKLFYTTLKIHISGKHYWLSEMEMEKRSPE